MHHAARNYAIVTAAYWGFTLTDGALRMLVLLHFYRLGYSPFTLAFLFLLYEAAGVAANLIGGWLATRYGITRMLTVGLATQIVGFTLLSMLQPGWTTLLSVAWVVAAQGVCGVAKDLTKTASKSAIKVTAAAAKEEGAGQLFRWVAWFTASHYTHLTPPRTAVHSGRLLQRRRSPGDPARWFLRLARRRVGGRGNHRAEQPGAARCSGVAPFSGWASC